MGNRRNRGILDGPIAQFWLERTPDKREVGSSSLPRPTSFFWRACPRRSLRRQRQAKSGGELAQLGERLLCKQEVTGSIPVFSTKFEVETEPF